VIIESELSGYLILKQ